MHIHTIIVSYSTLANCPILSSLNRLTDQINCSCKNNILSRMIVAKGIISCQFCETSRPLSARVVKMDSDIHTCRKIRLLIMLITSEAYHVCKNLDYFSEGLRYYADPFFDTS